MKDLSENQLIEALGTDPDAAMRELHARFSKLVSSLIVKTGVSHADSHDVAQIVWLNILRKSHLFDVNKGNFVGWLSQVCRNKSVDWIRGVGARTRTIDRLQEGDSQPECVATSAFDEVADQERLQVLWQALDELPESQREAVILYHVNNMSERAVARHLGLSLGTTRTRIKLGMEKLRRLLRPA